MTEAIDDYNRGGSKASPPRTYLSSRDPSEGKVRLVEAFLAHSKDPAKGADPDNGIPGQQFGMAVLEVEAGAIVASIGSKKKGYTTRELEVGETFSVRYAIADINVIKAKIDFYRMVDLLATLDGVDPSTISDQTDTSDRVRAVMEKCSETVGEYAGSSLILTTEQNKEFFNPVFVRA